MTTIGIDSVEIARFADWHTYSPRQLRRIFSAQEIEYCLKSQPLSAQRFAARFAVREALLKALSPAYPDRSFALLTICRHTRILRAPNGSPIIEIQWPEIIADIPLEKVPECTISWTHTKHMATAIVQLNFGPI